MVQHAIQTSGILELTVGADISFVWFSMIDISCFVSCVLSIYELFLVMREWIIEPAVLVFKAVGRAFIIRSPKQCSHECTHIRKPSLPQNISPRYAGYSWACIARKNIEVLAYLRERYHCWYSFRRKLQARKYRLERPKAELKRINIWGKKNRRIWQI